MPTFRRGWVLRAPDGRGLEWRDASSKCCRRALAVEWAVCGAALVMGAPVEGGVAWRPSSSCSPAVRAQRACRNLSCPTLLTVATIDHHRDVDRADPGDNGDELDDLHPYPRRVMITAATMPPLAVTIGGTIVSITAAGLRFSARSADALSIDRCFVKKRTQSVKSCFPGVDKAARLAAAMAVASPHASCDVQRQTVRPEHLCHRQRQS